MSFLKVNKSFDYGFLLHNEYTLYTSKTIPVILLFGACIT